MGLFSRERRWRSRKAPSRATPEGLQRANNRRLLVLRFVAVLLFSVLSLQLLRFQVLNSGHYQLKAESNRLRLVAVLPPRGLIYDRNHNALVRNVASYTAVIVPADIPKGGEADLYFRLSSVIGVPPDVIDQKVREAVKRADPFTPVPIKERLDQPTLLTLAELRHTLPGVDVRIDTVRQYDNSLLLSHVLGYIGKIDPDEYDQLKQAGYQLDDITGKTGVEYVYEDQLRGTPGKQQVEVDASGRQLSVISATAAKPGNSLVLSIDSDLQQHITDILQQSMLDTGSKSAVAVMMDVHTGEILADVSLPNYDINLFSGPVDDAAFQALLDDPGKPLVDHAIADQYAPGSTFKVITGSAALQLGVATPNTNISIPNTAKLVVSPDGDESKPGSVVYDWNPSLGTLDFRHAIGMSSDIYFYCMSGGCPLLPGSLTKGGVGMDNLAKFARAFGLGSKTGIDLPDETPGSISDTTSFPTKHHFADGTPQSPTLGDTYFMGIGESDDAASPMQMVRVAAAIANGGDVLRPHVVKEIVDASGNVVVTQGQQVVSHLPVSADNLRVIREGMKLVVNPNPIVGSAGPGLVPFLHGAQIAGKTGTAEFGSSNVAPSESSNGSYNEHGWFISFGPYSAEPDKPDVALVVFHDKGGGAATAAPTSAKIWDYYFNHYKTGDKQHDILHPPTPAPTQPAAR